MPCTYKDDNGVVCHNKTGVNPKTNEDYPFCKGCLFKMKRDRQQKFKDSAYRLVNQTQCHWVGNHPDEGFQIKCIEPPVRDGWCRIHKNDAKPTKFKDDEPSVGFEDGTSDIPKLPTKGKKAGMGKPKPTKATNTKNVDNMLDEIQDEDNLDTDSVKKSAKKASQIKSKKIQTDDLDDVMDEESSSKSTKKSKKQAVESDDMDDSDFIPKAKKTSKKQEDEVIPKASKSIKNKPSKNVSYDDDLEDEAFLSNKTKKPAKEQKVAKGKKTK